DFARVVVGRGEADYLSQAFVKNRGNALDLAYSQMTIDPVLDLTKANASGETTGYWNYENYIVTLERDVYSLPIGSEDATFIKPLEDIYYTYSLRAPLPFFGTDERTIALAPNGYIATATDMADQVRASSLYSFLFPSMESHFSFPKISFLFSDLSPPSGGVVWFKDLDDRFVLTFERVPEFTSNRGNTVQLELYYNGRIRITWLEVNAGNAIVGLSDGNGIPYDPATGKVNESDLSTMPDGQESSVIMEPVAPVFADERGTIDFSMIANAADGQNPVFTFSKVGALGEPVDLPTGASVTPASGAATRSATFHWTPSLAQAGFHVFRGMFTLGGKVASQDIRVVVGNTAVAPTLATTPSIIPLAPQDGQTMRLLYEYQQEEFVPEGNTDIVWLRNGVMMLGLTNRLEVPAQYTLPGQRWKALVTPVSFDGLKGITYESPEVTILPDSKTDINGDGKSNAVDLQIVVNSVLGLGPRSLNADVDGDFVVNARDVQLLVNFVVTQP
ncbi:MAG: dockerin type I domain-containing protein, partial [FCB group bacterium]|nr:dockerin type I domain-containing protein [FCB group bacterium]